MILREACQQFESEVEVAKYVNTYNDYDENAVIMAARSSINVLELLLKLGGDPDSSRHGFPLLSIAASNF